MWRALEFWRALRTVLKVRRAWRARTPSEFRDWLMHERSQAQFNPLREKYSILWASRIAERLESKQACVLAGSAAFLLASGHAKLIFGINKDEAELRAHAWTKWSGGEVQLDSSRHYEPLWEITS